MTEDLSRLDIDQDVPQATADERDDRCRPVARIL